MFGYVPSASEWPLSHIYGPKKLHANKPTGGAERLLPWADDDQRQVAILTSPQPAASPYSFPSFKKVPRTLKLAGAGWLLMSAFMEGR
ncbi:hypothetical protein LZ32DRAFT_404044 [Colletotrichum eremochloae]|nr:hypothetical protein LZ32DRAFT_404044 [Colletotrichum eremochloae]